MKITLIVATTSACLMAGVASAQSECLLPHDPQVDVADEQPPLSEITDPELLALIKKQQLEDELAPAVVDF